MEGLHNELLNTVDKYDAAPDESLSIYSTPAGLNGLRLWIRYTSWGYMTEAWHDKMGKTASLAAFVDRCRSNSNSVEKSIYPLFALKGFLPLEVAWIIVVAAHWSA
jgi:hypothetical protein